MKNDTAVLETRVLDLFPIADLGKLTMLEWQHEGRQLRDERIPFYSDEDIADIQAGFDPGSVWNSIVNHETGGDLVVELYDPQGRMIYDGQARLDRELEAFEESLKI